MEESSPDGEILLMDVGADSPPPSPPSTTRKRKADASPEQPRDAMTCPSASSVVLQSNTAAKEAKKRKEQQPETVVEAARRHRASSQTRIGDGLSLIRPEQNAPPATAAATHVHVSNTHDASSSISSSSSSAVPSTRRGVASTPSAAAGQQSSVASNLAASVSSSANLRNAASLSTTDSTAAVAAAIEHSGERTRPSHPKRTLSLRALRTMTANEAKQLLSPLFRKYCGMRLPLLQLRQRRGSTVIDITTYDAAVALKMEEGMSLLQHQDEFKADFEREVRNANEEHTRTFLFQATHRTAEAICVRESVSSPPDERRAAAILSSILGVEVLKLSLWMDKEDNTELSASRKMVVTVSTPHLRRLKRAGRSHWVDELRMRIIVEGVMVGALIPHHCSRCLSTEHTAKECTSAVVRCYRCKATDHRVSDCIAGKPTSTRRSPTSRRDRQQATNTRPPRRASSPASPGGPSSSRPIAWSSANESAFPALNSQPAPSQPSRLEERIGLLEHSLQTMQKQLEQLTNSLTAQPPPPQAADERLHTLEVTLEKLGDDRDRMEALMASYDEQQKKILEILQQLAGRLPPTRHEGGHG